MAARSATRKRSASEQHGTFSLLETAYEKIKQRITACEFRPGCYLNEVELSERLGIGRTPVHQAIDRLMMEGLVQVIPRKGIFVTPVSLDGVMQTIEVRLLNECHCARLAAERASEEDAWTLDDSRRSETSREYVDLVAYAYLPWLPAYHPTPQLPRPRIAIYGAPMRGIAPCGSRHGSLDNRVGSPWLEGQFKVYLKAQLQALASGKRTNDISRQMRNIARAMTAQEIDEATAYYASQPPEIVKATD